MRLEKWPDKETGEVKERFRVVAKSVTLRLNRIENVIYAEKTNHSTTSSNQTAQTSVNTTATAQKPVNASATDHPVQQNQQPATPQVNPSQYVEDFSPDDFDTDVPF